MGKKKYKEEVVRPVPRSILASLHEPLLDPKDGHGARSARDVMILQQWQAARKGDDNELMELVKLIVREDLVKLKAARGSRQANVIGGVQAKMRSLLPVMSLLKMVDVEKVKVAPEYDGYCTVTLRDKVRFKEWFEEYALGRAGVDKTVVADVRKWQAEGGIQRPYRGECD